MDLLVRRLNKTSTLKRKESFQYTIKRDQHNQIFSCQGSEKAEDKIDEKIEEKIDEKIEEKKIELNNVDGFIITTDYTNNSQLISERNLDVLPLKNKENTRKSCARLCTTENCRII